MLKKFIAILLLICLVAPFTGSYLFIHFKKEKIRKEISRIILKDLDEKFISVFKFTEKEVKALDWKHAGEFEYKSHMYDIVDQHDEAGFIMMTCYKDHKETSLNREKERLIAKALGQDPVRKEQTEKVKDFIKNVFKQEKSEWKSQLSQPIIIHYALNNKHYSLFSDSPLSPPPKYS